MKSAFDKIASGLHDAIAYAGGDETRARKSTVDVRAIRLASNMSQSAFAAAYRFPVATLRDWEQGRRRPDTGSVTLLNMISADPKAVEALIARV